MSIWSKLLGSDNIINKAADGIDAAFFTPEEKAKHFLETLKHYEPFKISQRIIAFSVAIPYILVWIASAIMFSFGAINENQIVVETSKQLAEMNNETLGTPFALIMGLYFGGGMLNGAIDRFKK